ncbi:MAG: putative aminohydrolase SsnA [Elusimicrobiota bacterium]|jgi:putative selenium metabolism protein SsnA
MKNDTLLIKNGTIVTLGEKNRVLERRDLLCEDGKIKKIGPSGSFKGKYRKVIDASGKVVMPGFINAHMHFYSTLVRGLGKAAPSKDFQEVLHNLWWRLDKKLSLEDSYYSALIPLIDAVRSGTTTLIDHHASPFACRGSLDRIAQAVKEVGLRASLCYELSDRDGDKAAQDGIDENAEFIRRCKTEGGDQFRALFGLHAAFTLTDATLQRAADAARQLGTGVHVHVAEAVSDQEYNKRKHGLSVVERLNRFGVLNPRGIVAHCVHVDEREREILASSGVAVVHNPQSNLNNAVGIADVLSLMRHGALVGLGTDAMTVNMREEVRVALWAQHLRQNNPSCGFVEMLSTLLFNNPKIASRHWGIALGVLEAGAAADIVLLDYEPPTPFDEWTFLGHFAFGLTQARVDTTIAAGRVLMENKRLKLDLDEAEVCAKSRELAKKLWARF